MTMQLSLTIDNIGLADLGQMKLNEFRKIFIETIRRYNFDNFNMRSFLLCVIKQNIITEEWHGCHFKKYTRLSGWSQMLVI